MVGQKADGSDDDARVPPRAHLFERGRQVGPEPARRGRRRSPGSGRRRPASGHRRSARRWRRPRRAPRARRGPPRSTTIFGRLCAVMSTLVRRGIVALERLADALGERGAELRVLPPVGRADQLGASLHPLDGLARVRRVDVRRVLRERHGGHVLRAGLHELARRRPRSRASRSGWPRATGTPSATPSRSPRRALMALSGATADGLVPPAQLLNHVRGRRGRPRRTFVDEGGQVVQALHRAVRHEQHALPHRALVSWT